MTLFEKQGWRWSDEALLPATKVTVAVLGGNRSRSSFSNGDIVDGAVDAFGLLPEIAAEDLLNFPVCREAIVRNLRYLPVEELTMVFDQLVSMTGETGDFLAQVSKIADDSMQAIRQFDTNNDEEIYTHVAPLVGTLVNLCLTNNAPEEEPRDF